MNTSALYSPSPYDTDARIIMASFTTPPTLARIGLINDAVLAAKAASIWTTIDGMWFLAAADAQAACINWKSPGTYDAVPFFAPTFAADRGYTGNGTNAYLETGISGFLGNTQFVQNSGTLAAWSRKAGQDSGAILGESTVSGQATIWPRYTDDLIYTRLNAAADDTTANTTGDGLFVLSRTGGNAVRLERNAVLISTYATASATPANRTFTILFGGNYWSGQCAFGFIGSGLTPTQMAALYNSVVLPYMVAVGAA